MKLRELADLLVGARCNGEPETDISGIEVDSRHVTAGDLFICLVGATVDGHDYVEQAVANGAAAVVAERTVTREVPTILVDDARFAMAVLAAHFYGYPSKQMKVIGVTGTNGKTTTTHLLERMLEAAGYKTGLIGTIGVRVDGQFVEAKNTTPDALELQRTFHKMAELGTQYVLMEVSSHALDMGRVKGVHFRSGVFTNLTQDHLDYHQTMERYQAAKRLLFARMNNGYTEDADQRQFAILNVDDAATADYAQSTSAQLITYGIDRSASVRACDIRISAQGTTFRCESFAGDFQVSLKMIGKFSVYNALAAIAVCLAERVPVQVICDSLAQVSGVDGRFEPVDAGQPFTVIVDYAHTPDSLQNVLTTIREFATGKVITVFGCGGNRDRGKRPIMAGIAAQYSDVVIATSDNPRFEDPSAILQDVEQGLLDSGKGYQLIVDRREAIGQAIRSAEPGDIVLIAGKGHETYQEIQGVRHPSDDRVLAREAIRGNGL